MRTRALRNQAAGVIATVLFLFPVLAAGQIIVNSTTDSSPPAVGELRWAVQVAETDGTPSVITFSGLTFPATINLTQGPLLLVNEAQTWVQGPGANQLEINAAGAPQAFIVATSGNAISDLSIYGASSEQILLDGISPSAAQTNWIYGCHLGLDLNGVPTLGNQTGVHIDGAQALYNLVGTDGVPASPGPGGTPGFNGEPAPAVQNIATGATNDVLERNYISANATSNGGNPAGVLIEDGAAGNRVAGNFIGTDLSGASSFPNWNGVFIHNGSFNNCVGISDDSSPLNFLGGGEADEWNLISGNEQNGVFIDFASENWISGNLIGTDVNGTTLLTGTNASNLWHGVWMTASSGMNIVGTDGDGSADTIAGAPTGGERNVISGNEMNGVLIDGLSTMNKVAGNYIGVDITGLAALANILTGVEIADASQNLVGTDVDGVSDSVEVNVISGNGQDGIYLATDQALIWGNIIGLDATESPLPGGNTSEGVVLSAATSCSIGYDALGIGAWLAPPPPALAIQGNVIADNGSHGIVLSGSPCSGNAIFGNFIGTDSAQTLGAGNQGHGISMISGANNNSVGGYSLMQTIPPNVIWNNQNDGINIDDTGGSGTVQNPIRANSISSNTNQGIENVNNGNTEETPPVITGVNYSAGTMSGTTAAEDSSVVDVFADSADEGAVFLGETTVSSGAWTVSSITWPTPPFNVTATVTDTSGNTSEFSAPQTVTRVQDWMLMH